MYFNSSRLSYITEGGLLRLNRYLVKYHDHYLRKVVEREVEALSEDQIKEKMKNSIIGSHIVLDIKKIP